MKPLDWMTRWQRRRMAAAPQTAVETTARQPHRMSGTYKPLHVYLEQRYADTAVLTFDQIESLLGFALPDRARTHGDWWTSLGAGGAASRHGDAWLLAGRTAKPNLLAGTVAFERVSS